MTRSGFLRILLTLLACAGLGTTALALMAGRIGVPAAERAELLASLGTLACFLAPMALLASDEIVTGLRRLVDGRPMTTFAIAGALVLPYLLYWTVAAGSSAGGLARILIYAGLATGAGLAPSPKRFPWSGDLLLVLVLWLPLELGALSRSFPWPSGGAGRILAGPLALDLLLFLVLVVRKDDGLGYSFRFRGRDVATAVAAFAVFLVAGVPLGRLTGFIGPPHLPGHPLDVPLTFVAIFLFTGIQEESLFRGLIQRSLERWVRRPGLALVIASLVFGAAHLNNGPSPNWRYGFLATIAGLAYGWTYRRTGRLSAAGLTHALVDTTWSAIFKGRG